jgi:DNA polymerase-3 subunit delta
VLVRAPRLDKRLKLHKTLRAAGRVLEFPAADAQGAAELADDVRALGEERGLDIDRPTAVLLAEACAGDFYCIDSELEKARSWLGGAERARVTRELLGQLTAGSAVLSGWEVAGALLRGRRGEALVALERLLEGGEEPLRLLGGLAFRSRSMLQARALIDGGMPPARAVRAARIWGLRPDEATRGLSRYTTARLLGFPALLLDADRTLKSRSLAPRAVLGALLERMMPDDDGGQGRGR